MSTTCNTTSLAQSSASTQRVFSFFQTRWMAFQEWCNRERLRAELFGLSDSELMDIGVTRGEIDYCASNRSIDPRGGGR